MRSPLLVIAWLLSWLATEAQAGRAVYGWRDAEGVQHFSDRVLDSAAERVTPDGRRLSVIAAPPASAANNAMRPLLEQERRWQQENRARDRRQAQEEIAQKQRHCAGLQQKLAAAERQRDKAKLRAVEEQWFAGCRP